MFADGSVDATMDSIKTLTADEDDNDERTTINNDIYQQNERAVRAVTTGVHIIHFGNQQR